MGVEIEADGLKKLEYLSLVSKVCTELEAHLGLGDKVLAEFITEMGRTCEIVDEFDAKFKEHGEVMPDYFVRTLLTIIHAILPPRQKSKSEKGAKEKEKSTFSALNIKDGKERVKELEREIEEEVRNQRRLEDEEYNKSRDNDRRERKRDRDGGDREERGRYADRGRRGDRGERGRHGDENGYRDERGRARHGDRDRNKDEGNWKNGYEEGRDPKGRGQGKGF
ncbi:hypothetical protein OROGR_017216 [Orobanche gracilis]